MTDVRDPDFLKAEEFAAFFEAVHEDPAGRKRSPFAWQERLAQKVFAGGWDEVIDAPTGAGKTAAIDIAVFHLALQAALGEQRDAATRILFVVDRRLIVDEAHKRAEKIADKLKTAQDDVLVRVAARLQLLAEADGPPLAVTKLRGGAPKDPDWVRTPAQPTVVVSTVDQVGSRLLFRGYGVSDSMKPLHAGLIGSDALLLLDEAHLSQPFVQTARDLTELHKAGLRMVTLSATPANAGDATVFRLSEKERAEDLIARRLGAKKLTTLVETSAGELADVLAEQAWKLSRVGKDGGEACIVAVVVNRVARARAVFEALQKRGARPLVFDAPEASASADEAAADLVLRIGRSRELDRRRLTEVLLDRTRAGREPRDVSGPLFVVATQTIEVGADLDFDALVTEIAPFDCLRQRFGRLDRLGDYGRARGVVVAASGQVAKNAKPDPIYGPALKATWTLLVEAAGSKDADKKKRGKRAVSEPTIDFGVAASQAWLPSGETLAACLAPRADAPVLLPRDVALWSRTSPVPAVDPEVSLYLHGPAGGPDDVNIVWRADLSGDDLDVWTDRVAACAPSALEAIAVPIGEARRWLRWEEPGDVADVEAAAGTDDPERAPSRRALRWRGADDEKTAFVSARSLRPGDTIVVPSTDGGCDGWGWAPQSRTWVPDLARAAMREHRGRDVLRLTRASAELGLDPPGERDLAARLSDLTDREIIGEFEANLRTAAERETDRPAKGVRVVRRDGRPVALERKLGRFTSADAVTEDDDSARSARRVLLGDHCQGVADRAQNFAAQAGLTEQRIKDVALAGLLHDLGKAHPAFQMVLYGGSELAALAGPALAKSGTLPQGRTAREAARRHAGFPKGGRHEVASLALAAAHPRFADANDPELVLWLIGTHHGYGRPFFPAVDWPGRSTEPIEVSVDGASLRVVPDLTLATLTAQWVDLFERLQARYGAWELARLEAILRLADHRQSEAEGEAEAKDEADQADAPREAAE